MSQSDHFHSGFFIGALLGGAIASATVLLFTTKQGRKIKQGAMETFSELEDVAENLLNPAPKPRSRRSNKTTKPA